MYFKGHVETVDTKDQRILFVNTVDTSVCGSYTTPYTEYYEVWKLYSTLYKVASPLQGGRLLYCAFCLVDLAVHQPEEAALLTFLDLSTTRVIAGKTHSKSPILKIKGALSNPVILRYLQSCILHTLTKLPASNFDLKSIFNAWRTWACIIPLEVAGSVSGKVGSHEQVDLPIHRLQH